MPCRVRKIRSHYTFEQRKFNKEFVTTNQVSRQNAQTDVEKDFYKLMNNSNFGCDCRNNADTCFFDQFMMKSRNCPTQNATKK